MQDDPGAFGFLSCCGGGGRPLSRLARTLRRAKRTLMVAEKRASAEAGRIRGVSAPRILAKARVLWDSGERASARCMLHDRAKLLRDAAELSRQSVNLASNQIALSRAQIGTDRAVVMLRVAKSMRAARAASGGRDFGRVMQQLMAEHEENMSALERMGEGACAAMNRPQPAGKALAAAPARLAMRDADDGEAGEDEAEELLQHRATLAEDARQVSTVIAEWERGQCGGGGGEQEDDPAAGLGLPLLPDAPSGGLSDALAERLARLKE